MEKCDRMVVQLNNHFQYMLRVEKDNEIQTENVLEKIVNEKPYKILPGTKMLFKV